MREVYFAKFLIALYTSTLAPLLPLLMAKMKLSLTLVGALISVFSLFNSLSQPISGFIRDRMDDGNVVLFLAPFWVGIFIGAIGVFGNYSWLIICLICAGIGISSFHPAAFAYIGRIDSNRRAFGISYLLLADSLGFVVGPFAVSLFISAFGIERLYIVAIPGLLVTVALYKTISPKRKKVLVDERSVLGECRQILRSAISLFIFNLSITIVCMNLFSFAPILLKERGVPINIVGLFLSAFALGSAAGPFLGSVLAEKIGRLKAIKSLMIFSICFELFFLLTRNGIIQITFFFFTGLALMGPFSIIIGMAQERFHQRLGAVSVFMSGFAWGTGGLSVILAGMIAETIGIRNMLGGLIIFPLGNLLVSSIADWSHWMRRFHLGA